MSRMSPDRIAAAYADWGRSFLSDQETHIVQYMYQDGRPLSDIARATGRCLGTVKSVVSRLRRAGLVGRRYA